MSGINNQTPGVSQSPIGSRLPRFLTSQANPTANAPAYGNDQLNLVAGGADPSQDPNAIAQMLQNPDPRQRFQAVINATKLPPQQAIPLLQMAASNDNPQVVQLAQRALQVMQQMPGAQQPQTTAPGQQYPQNPQYPQQPGQQQAPGQYQPPGQYQQPGQFQQPGVFQPQPTQQQQPQYQQPQLPPQGQPFGPFDPYMMQTMLTTGSDAERIAATSALAQYAQSNRQDVVNMCLRLISRGSANSNPTGQTIAAINVLQQMGAQEAIPYLRDDMIYFQAYQSDVGKAAAAALDQLSRGPNTAGVNGQPPFDPYLMQTKLTTGSEAERVAATQSLAQFAQTNRQDVLNMCLRLISRSSANSNPVSQTVAAINVLQQMGAQEAIPYLRDDMIYFQSYQADIGKAALAALRQIGQGGQQPGGIR